MGQESAAAASVDRWRSFPRSPKAAPWLVIPYRRKQAFFDICEPNSKVGTKSIRELIAKTFFQKPSHRGWLIILCDDEKYDYSPDEYKFGDCFLLNPTTLKTIRLPSLLKWFGESTGYWIGDCVYDKENSLVLFTFSDANEGNCNVVFLYCHPGDKEWETHKWFSETIVVRDMISLHCFKGEFYLMCAGEHNLRISYVCDYDGRISLSITTIEVKGIGSYPLVGGYETSSMEYSFLATSDQLYCIPITYPLGGFRKVVIHMAVMSLDFTVMEWKVVNDIGDSVLFIGCNTTTSACCSAADMGFATGMGCLYFNLPDNQCLYKFDVVSTGNSVLGLSLKAPGKGSEFIMMPNRRRKRRREGHRRREEHSEDEQKLEAVQYPWLSLKSCSRGKHFPVLSLRSCSTTQDTDFPWLMFCKDLNLSTFYFINSKHDIERFCLLPDLDQAVVRFQKGGWLLVSMENNDFGLFFYNPLTGETIKLPELPAAYTFSSTSFSSLPTSPDCVVLAIEQDADCRVCLYYIRKGEATWTCYHTKTKKYTPSYNAPIFYNGGFYHVDYNGSLGVFKIEEDNSISWEVLKKPHKLFNCTYPSFLVECDGKLLLVKTGSLGKLSGIFRLDISSMQWVEIKDLGQHMLFVSYTSCFSVIAPNCHMGNKVYFPRLCMNGDGVLFYCLKTSSYRSFGSHFASDFTGTEGWYLNCTWIEPNWSNSPAHCLGWIKCPSSNSGCCTWTEPIWSKYTSQELA